MANFHFSWLMFLSNVTNRRSFRKFKMLINYTLVKYDKCHQTNAIHRIFTIKIWICITCIPHHHNRFTALFRDHPGEPVQEEDFWTLWCKGKLTEADTSTIRLGATPSGLFQCPPPPSPYFFTGQMPFLPQNQQHQSTEGNVSYTFVIVKTQIISMTIL